MTDAANPASIASELISSSPRTTKPPFSAMKTMSSLSGNERWRVASCRPLDGTKRIPRVRELVEQRPERTGDAAVAVREGAVHVDGDESDVRSGKRHRCGTPSPPA